MRKMMAVAAMVSVLSGTAWAQTAPPVETREFSRGLAWAGILTMITGGVLMVPWPEGENYNILGDSICVIEGYRSFDIKDGTCATFDPLITAGLITVGAGAVMTMIGLHKVKVSPQLGHGVVGAKVSIRF